VAKKIPKPPPSPEARENVLTVIRSGAEPLNAAALTKLLLPPHDIAAKELESILEEFVAAGALLRLPGKTATGKPQYWDRDPASLRRAALQKALESAEFPQTVQDLAKNAAIPGKPKPAELLLLMEELIAAGVAFAMPVGGAKAKPRFWNRPPVDFGRLSLRRLLETKGPQTEVKLRAGLKEFSDEQFRTILESGLAAKELFRHPAAGKVKKELIGARPASPEPYLGEIAAQLAKIVPQLLAANLVREELRRYLVQVIETAGIPFSPSAVASGTSAPDTRTDRSQADVDLVALIRQLEPGADRGALVGARDLRRAARLEKGQFDRTVLDLARQGRLSLHYHDYPASLTPAERDELVTDGNGTYYVGIALRQNSL